MMAMSDHTSRLPPLPSLIAAALVVLGVGLWMFVGKAFLWVAGLGAFGPGILRELDWLKDQDEFQREAARRAGYHAYLVGGSIAVIAASALDLGPPNPGGPGEWVTLLLLVLWVTWLFSALLEYWGAQKTVARVLMTFGVFWLVFVVASLIGEFGPPESTGDLIQGLLGVAAGLFVVVPFFLLAWSAQRWPKQTGALLLLVGAGFIAVFFRPVNPNMQLSSTFMTATMLLVPVLASGIALLRLAPDETAPGDEA